MKDFSDYIKPKDPSNIFIKRTMKSLAGHPLEMLEWHILESKFPDGSPAGRYVQMKAKEGDVQYIVNTGSRQVMDQLEEISRIQDEANETDRRFTFTIIRQGRGVLLAPVKESKNVGPVVSP